MSSSDTNDTPDSPSDTNHLGHSPNDLYDTRLSVSDTTLTSGGVSPSESCHVTVNDTRATAGGLCHSKVTLGDTHQMTEMSRSVQVQRQGQSSLSTLKVGLLQPVQCHKPILPSSLRHLEAAGQINYVGSFSVDPNTPRLLLTGAPLHSGSQPLVLTSSIEDATNVMHTNVASSNLPQVTAMCSAGGALPSSTVWNANTLSEAGYLPGVLQLPRGTVSMPREQLVSGMTSDVSLAASVVTPDRLTVTGGVSCSTLKSFVQSDVCQSLAATCDAASP